MEVLGGVMGLQVRRLGILAVALSVLSVALVACQAPAVTGSSTGGGSTGISLITQAAGSLSPTPTFPPITIGAWPSSYSPGNPDTITIYAILRVQDQSMQTPSQPPNPGLPVSFLIGAPINQSATVKTGPDGVAATTVAFSDPSPGVPVIVTVTVTYKGVPYSNQTFFTPGATFTPTPKATAGKTPSPGASPSPTP